MNDDSNSNLKTEACSATATATSNLTASASPPPRLRKSSRVSTRLQSKQEEQQQKQQKQPQEQEPQEASAVTDESRGLRRSSRRPVRPSSDFFVSSESSSSARAHPHAHAHASPPRQKKQRVSPSKPSRNSNNQKKQMQKLKQKQNNNSNRRKSSPLYLYDENDQQVWIVTATLQDIQAAQRRKKSPHRPHSLVHVPSLAARTAVYERTAQRLSKIEQQLLPLYGGRPWQVHVTLKDATHTCAKNSNSHSKTPYFVWTEQGQLELAVYPHLWEKIPYAQTYPGQPGFLDDSQFQAPLSCGLSVLAWDERWRVPLPVLTMKWMSPLHERFSSRTSAWARAKQLAIQQVALQRVLQGVVVSSKRRRPLQQPPSRKAVLQAGKWRFERDGLWIIGQEEEWQKPQPNEDDDKDDEDVQVEEQGGKLKTRKMTGLALYLQTRRKEYQQQRLRELQQQQSHHHHPKPAPSSLVMDVVVEEAAATTAGREKDDAAVCRDGTPLRAAANADLTATTADEGRKKPPPTTTSPALEMPESRVHRVSSQPSGATTHKNEQGEKPESGDKILLNHAMPAPASQQGDNKSDSPPQDGSTDADGEETTSKTQSLVSASGDKDQQVCGEADSKKEASEPKLGTTIEPKRVPPTATENDAASSSKLLEKTSTQRNGTLAPVATGQKPPAGLSMTVEDQESSPKASETNVPELKSSGPKTNDNEVAVSTASEMKSHASSEELTTGQNSDTAVSSTANGGNPIKNAPSGATVGTDNEKKATAASVAESVSKTRKEPLQETSAGARVDTSYTASQTIETAKASASAGTTIEQSGTDSTEQQGSPAGASKKDSMQTEQLKAKNASKASFTLRDAETELRVLWKQLTEEERQDWSERARAIAEGGRPTTLVEEGSAAIVSPSPPHPSSSEACVANASAGGNNATALACASKQNAPKKKAGLSLPIKPGPSSKWRLNEAQIKLCYEAGVNHYNQIMETVKVRDLTRELQDGFDLLRERGRGRFDMELPVFDTPEFSFLTDLKKAPWMPVVREILGKEVVLIHKGIFMSLPNAERQVYHQDGVHLTTQYQKKCHAINVFVPLVDIVSQGTEFCLGSHILGHEDYDRDFVYTPRVEAGNPIIFDYRLGHRGLANSTSSIRPVVYCSYAAAADGKEFRDSVNFSRKRYRAIGDLVDKAPSREERARKRQRRTGDNI